jgi:fatty-acid peroxygenase
MVAMVDAVGGVGPRYWRGRVGRLRSQIWARQAIRAARAGQADGPLAQVAWHRDADGRLLREHVAAVELINLVRPTTAVAWFVAYGALMLAQHPQWRAAMADPTQALAFAQEVRRTCPLAPFTAGRAIAPLDLVGVRVRPNTRLALDIYGMHHDPTLWPAPDDFDPRRFDPDPAGDRPGFAPQGAGDVASGHRCPGEGATLGLLVEALRTLAAGEWDLPDDHLEVSLRRMPPRFPVRIATSSVSVAAAEVSA